MLEEKIDFKIEELKQMIKDKKPKDTIEEKRRELDMLLEEYIKEI